MNNQQPDDDALWQAAETLMRIARDSAPGEHFRAKMDPRVLIEQSPNGGTRVVIADDRWLREHNGYFKWEYIQPHATTRRET